MSWIGLLRKSVGYWATGDSKVPVVGTPAIVPPQRRTLIIIGAAAGVLVYALLREVVGELAARALSILAVAAIYWATEALPLFATSFLVVGLEIVTLADTGGLGDEITFVLDALGVTVHSGAVPGSIDASMFLRPFADDVIILFLGGFLLSAALVKHGVDRVIAHRLLRSVARFPGQLLAGLLLTSAFFSMWMSNTATTAMVLAIARPLVRRVPEGERFRVALLLAVPFGANIGGIATPIGTPPNAIAFGALNSAGYQVTFLQWMIVAVPLAVILLGATWMLLFVSYRPSSGLALSMDWEEPVPLAFAGRTTLTVLLVTIALWLTSGFHGVRPGATALLAAAALTAFGVLDRDDVDSIDWDILILMWGGLALGAGLSASGLMVTVGQMDLSLLPGGHWGVAGAVALTGLIFSTFMSNTATAALLVPVALALAGAETPELVMLGAIACSVAMALPVSTPPNAIAYATGSIRVEDMRRTGGVISLLALVILLAGYRLVLPWIF